MLCECIVENHDLPEWAIQPMRFRAMTTVMTPRTIRPFFEVMAGMHAISMRSRIASRVASMMVIIGLSVCTTVEAVTRGGLRQRGRKLILSFVAGTLFGLSQETRREVAN